MSAITAKASRKMKKYAVLAKEPRCFLGSFDFSWEQRKFSDVVATRRGLTYKPSDIRKNGVRVLRSSNIAEDSFVLSDEDVFVVREAVNIDCVRANDILITAANGSSRLVGKHTIISGIPEESAVHGGFMLLGTTKEPHFVNASMGSSWYRRFIELFVAGGNGAIGNLNKNDLDNQDIAIPSEKEQKKIGSFFRQLDNLITLHQRKGKAAVSGCFLNYSSLEKSSAQSRTLELFGQTSNQEIKYIIDGLSILGGKLRNFCVKLIILLSYTRINDIAKYHISRNTECVHNIN